MQNKYIAIAAPRGSSKTTIIGFTYIAHSIAFKRKHFIVILSNTFGQAAMILDSIKSEVKENRLFKKDFRLKVVKDAEGDSIFEHPDGFKVRVLCKGAEQAGTIRGAKFGAHRPDLIVVDDVENDELVRSPVRRQKLQDDFDNAVIPAGDIDTQYIIVGTIMHDDSLLSKLIAKDTYTEYYKRLFGALYDYGEESYSIWPEKYSVEWLEKLALDRPATFAREYQNNPVAGLMQRFKEENFRYWRIDNMNYITFDKQSNILSKGTLMDCKAAIACDLAWSERKEADDTVILPAFLTPSGDILVDTFVCKKGMRPNEFMETIFTMETRLRSLTGSSVPIGLEKAMLERVYQSILKAEMSRRQHFLIIREVKWETDKITRIETVLEPRYAQQVIYHKQGMGNLEQQLLRFPSAAHDDICFSKGTLIATPFGHRPIEELKEGNFVLTPFGYRKVKSCGITGVSKTINKFGLNITPNHKVFSNNGCFASIDTIQCEHLLNKLTFKEVFRWRYKRLLNLMELNTHLWEGRKDIISLSQIQILGGRILKDFMLRFGSFITELKFLKAGTFIILTGIALTTTFLILHVFLLGNIIRLLRKLIVNLLSPIWIGLDHLRKYGTPLRKEGNGIGNMLFLNGRIRNSLVLFVQFVVSVFSHAKRLPCAAPKIVETKKDESEEVYNLSVNIDSVYYANNILVSNCDALQTVIKILQYPKKRRTTPPEEDAFMWFRKLAIDAKKPKIERYTYGNKGRVRSWIPADITYK